MSMNNDAKLFLVRAKNISKGTGSIPTKWVTDSCNMNTELIAQVMSYLEDKGYIKDTQKVLGELYPVTFRISADGYDWLDE